MNRKKFSKKKKNPNRVRQSKKERKSDEFKLQYFIQRNLAHHALPKPMHGGHIARFRMLSSTFGAQTGLSNVGGSSGPGQLIQNSATTLNAAVAFQLSDVAGYTSWTSIFDQYRVKEVLLRFKARSNAVSVQNTAAPNSAVPTAYIVRDLDDNSALTQVSDALQYDTCQTFNGEEDCVVIYEPSVTPAIYSGGAFSGYGIQKAADGWLDVANPSIPHFGIKLCVGGLTASTTSSWVWDMTCEAIVEFQNTR